MALRFKGLKMVADMPTPFAILETMKAGHNTWHRMKWSAKVQGDIRAVVPGTGQSVLAEVKTVKGDRLVFSKLRPHQVTALTEHAAIGGLSLLIWVTDYGNVYVLKWPIPGFRPRTSLKYAEAGTYEWEGVDE
jgi:hypothetical protein